MKTPAEHRQIEIEAINRLQGLLNSVPFLRVTEGPRPTGGSKFESDGLIKVQHSNGWFWIVLEVRRNAQLRDARASIEQVRKLAANLGAPAYGVFASNYLSSSIRQLCTENNVGWFDFSGSCRIVFDSVFIEKEAASAETHERKRFKSLFSPKSSRVMRRLLSAPNRSWRVQLLAEEAQVSPATVSLLKEKLLRDEYAINEGDAFVLRKPEELLQEWALQYHSREHQQLECYGQAELPELEAEFAAHCTMYKIDYAFTMFSGAKRVAPFTRGIQRGYAYISAMQNADDLARNLNWKPVNSGGNFRIITPDDNDILFGTQEISGDIVVSDIQLYLDLAGHRGRGVENAEFLLEQRIRPKWH